MAAVLRSAAVVVTLLGTLSALVVALRSREVRLPVAVLLDFLLAAGLLRLAAAPTGRAIASAAVVVLVRRVVSTGLARSTRALSSAGDVAPGR